MRERLGRHILASDQEMDYRGHSVMSRGSSPEQARGHLGRLWQVRRPDSPVGYY